MPDEDAAWGSPQRKELQAIFCLVRGQFDLNKWLDGQADSMEKADSME